MEPKKGKYDLWYAGKVGFATREEAERFIRNGMRQDGETPKQLSVGTSSVFAGFYIRLVAIVGLGAAIVFGVIYALGGGGSGSGACGSESMAYAMSQRFVERQLLSPNSAKFPLMTQARVVSAGGCFFDVAGYVDSQNALGAMLRTRYFVEMEYDPGGKVWRAHNLQLE